MKQKNGFEAIPKTLNYVTSVFVDGKNNLSKENVIRDYDSFFTKIATSLNRMCHLKFEILYTPKYIKLEEEITRLHQRYAVEFSKLSRAFETWSEKRRLTIKKLRDAAKQIDSLKLVSCKGRMVFSAADAIGTVGAIVMREVNSDWASKMLFTAGFLGCISFACSIVDHVKTRRILEDLLDEFRADIDGLENIQKMLRTLSNFQDSVQELFPHHVDRQSIEALKTRKRLEPNVRKEFKAAIKDLFPHDEHMDICLAVLLSNGKRNPKLLEDDDFLAIVLIFSRSLYAEKWWNRTGVEERLLFSSSLKVLSEMKSLLKSDTLPIQFLPLLSTYAVYADGMSTIIAVLLNSLVVLDASLELTGKEPIKESEVCRKLGNVLNKEFRDFEAIYELLNPYWD